MKKALLTLACLAATFMVAAQTGHSGLPGVFAVGDDRGEAFASLVEKGLKEKMVVYGTSGEGFRARYAPAANAGGAARAVYNLTEGDCRVLLLCCAAQDADSLQWAEVAAVAARRDMEVLWYGDPRGAVGRTMARAGVCTADYAGFCRGQKNDGDQPRAAYIADAAAQWWTGVARTNEGVQRVKLWNMLPPAYEYSGPECMNAVARIDRISEPELEIFLPVPANPVATLIFFPGGGYSFTGFLRNAREAAVALAPHGIAVVGLKYRNKRKTDVTLADAQRAVRMVRSHAAEWGLNGEEVGVAGQSAGAHLVLNLSANFTAGDPAPADPVERLSSRPDFSAVVTAWNFGSNDVPYAFPPDTPPFFIRQARNDSSFLLAERLVEALRAAGIPTDHRFVDTGGHGAFEIAEGNPHNGWTDELARWVSTLIMNHTQTPKP